MDKYKRLASNTLIFAIGTFSSKLLSFFLMRLYTEVLNTDQYGVTDLIQQSGNLLLPLVTLGITNAVVRFGLEKGVSKQGVFTTGLFSLLGGMIVLLAISPFLGMVDLLSEHIWLLILFVFMSSLRSLCAQFVRSQNRVKLFAIDGILSTATTIGFNVLFLIGMKDTAFGGVFGYIFSIVCSDALSVVFLFIVAKLHRYICVRGFDVKLMRAMLKYSIPLIPNTILWWITNVSDRYLVADFLGEGANGLYAAAYKIPSLIMLVSGIFMDAWQISAFTEEEGRERFYTKVMSTYSALLFAMASGVILCTRFVPHVLFAEEYYKEFCNYILLRKPDIVGHFDLITKFDQKEKSIFFNNKEYIALSEKYIKQALKSDCIFEINTGAIARGYRTTPYPAENLLYAMKENNAKITIQNPI